MVDKFNFVEDILIVLVWIVLLSGTQRVLDCFERSSKDKDFLVVWERVIGASEG